MSQEEEVVVAEGEDDMREREKGEERRHMMAHGQRLLEKRYPPTEVLHGVYAGDRTQLSGFFIKASESPLSLWLWHFFVMAA